MKFSTTAELRVFYFCLFVCLNVVGICQNPEKNIMISIKILDSTAVFYIDINIHQISITMISEGSCDPENWSNDAENSALHHRNKLYLKIYSNRKLQKNNISQ